MDVAQKLHFDAYDIGDEELNVSCRANSSGCNVAMECSDSASTVSDNKTLYVTVTV